MASKQVRLYTRSRSTHARNIMLSTPDAALEWVLQSLAVLQSEVQANMIRDGFIPDDENPDNAPTIVLSFDVKGVRADVKEKANGQDLGH